MTFIINKKIEEVSNLTLNSEFIDFGDVTYTEKNRAVVKVQDGCNMFCTYCIIPYAKGRVRSRKLENVIEEIKKIADKGIKEVVITGIHVASYGIDFDNNTKEALGINDDNVFERYDIFNKNKNTYINAIDNKADFYILQ